jgi:hypothetical protein
MVKTEQELKNKRIILFLIIVGVLFFGIRVNNKRHVSSKRPQLKIKNMKNLPVGMVPDRDNVVYYDSERKQLYIIQWADNQPFRYYIPKK